VLLSVPNADLTPKQMPPPTSPAVTVTAIGGRTRATGATTTAEAAAGTTATGRPTRARAPRFWRETGPGRGRAQVRTNLGLGWAVLGQGWAVLGQGWAILELRWAISGSGRNGPGARAATGGYKFRIGVG
jgi:hypothetical protein